MGNAGNIGWDTQIAWDKALADYYVLAGMGIDYGAPGEGEITLIRKDAVPRRPTTKGGPGSGFHGHSGRPGKRGGSDNDGSTGSPTGGTPAAQRKPSATLSDRPVTRTQAIAVAIQKLDGGKPTGNLLASDAGKHFFALGFKGPVIKQLYDLSQMYKAGGAPRQKAIGAIMTALASDTELGDALRAQIDTEDELAKEKAKKAGVRPAKIGNLPTAGKQGGRGSGASEEEKRLAADRARAQRDHDQELADQIAAEKRKKGKESARWRKVGETVYLGTRPIVDATDHGDTVSSGEAVISWTEVVAGYHVLAGLAVSYGDPNGAITLLRRDALPKRGSATKGGPGSGFHGHAGRPGERGGSRKEGNTQMSRSKAEAFAEGSKAPGAYYHATSAQAAAAIRDEGFRLDVRHSGNFFGEGVYFTNKKGVKFFGDTDVEVRVNVKNPYIHLPEPDEPTQPLLTKLSTSPFADEIAEKMAADNTLSKAKALTLVLQEKGYDSVITREDEDVLVVFDPADIAIVEADAPSLKKSVSAEKGGPGSGFHGHAGRPGERGGSAPRSSAPTLGEIEAQGASHSDAIDAMNYDADPVVRAWLGGDVGLPDESQYSTLRMGDRTIHFKDKIVTELSADIGIRYADANAFIKSWADSSNQGYGAQLIQRTAAEVFDTPYSDWQQSLWEQENRLWERDFNDKLDYLNLFDEIDADSARHLKTQALDGLPFPHLARERFEELFPTGLALPLKRRSVDEVVAERNRIEAGVRQVRDEQADVVKRALRSIYDRTQRDLQEQGIEDVILYRGFGGEQAAVDLGDEIAVTFNALSSWSADHAVADSFAKTGRAGQTFAIKVSADRVFSTPRTGFGCLNEWEFVVLGHTADRASVITVYEDGKKRSSVKSKEFAMKIINLDDSDVNADWIKLVNPEATARDRALHAKLAGEADTSEADWPEPKTDSAEDWPDVEADGAEDWEEPETDTEDDADDEA